MFNCISFIRYLSFKNLRFLCAMILKFSQFFAILKSLKENGADLNAKDYRGRTVLECLKFFGNRELN